MHLVLDMFMGFLLSPTGLQRLQVSGNSLPQGSKGPQGWEENSNPDRTSKFKKNQGWGGQSSFWVP